MNARDPRSVRQRTTSGRPAWEDAHSPLHAREFLTAPRSGTVRPVSAAAIADALGTGHPLYAPLTAGEGTVMAYMLAVPERRVPGLDPVNGSFVCLPSDPVEIQIEVNRQRACVTLDARHITSHARRPEQPAPIGELRILRAPGL